MKPIEHASLGAKAYAQLKDALLKAELAPSQRLNFRQVAAALNISVTPAREALLQLVAEGVLLVDRAGSVMVPAPDPAIFDEIQAIRGVVEPFAAGRGLRALTPEDYEVLAELNDEMMKAPDTVRRAQFNQRFHFYLYGLSRMPNLLAIIENLWLKLAPYRYIAGLPSHKPGPGQGGDHPHVAILEALRERDRAKLSRALRADLERTGKVILDALRSS